MWRRASKDVAASICERVRKESTRNKRLTKTATQSVINHLIKDAAENLSATGKARIQGFGRFEINMRTGKLDFHPYDKFLADIDLNTSFYSDDDDDDEDDDGDDGDGN
eukprot:g1604.t1